MRPIRRWKQTLSLAAVVAVACGALQAATPMPERSLVSPDTSRDTHLRAHKPRTVLGQSWFGVSDLRAPARAGTASRGNPVPEAEPTGEPRFDPWSLIAGGLGVMMFIARRRRAD